MRIVVNTRLLLKDRLEGIGWFTHETLKRICTQHPEHEFFFVFDRKWDDEFIYSSNITPLSMPPQARHPLLYYLWFNYSIPYVLKKVKPDLFISPDGYLPLNLNVKTLAVMHDLNFEHYPQDLPPAERYYYRRFFPRYAANADRIGTVSEFSKRDISELYKINPDKIDVLYNGANEFFEPSEEFTKSETKNKYADGKQYFLYVGALNPRKNIVNLLKAYEAMRENHPDVVKLVIVGAKMWRTSDIYQTVHRMKYRDDINFCSRLNVQELKNLYGAALALTYVSYFEGFGIPIVEAFCCDTPVITSNVTSMPEVAGDAALLIDPFSVSSIADAMLQIVSSDEVRQSLIAKGRIRQKAFTWQKSADKFWDSILKTVS